MNNSIITQKKLEATVIIKDSKEMVRSDRLAEMFGKQHKNILKIINNKQPLLLATIGASKIADYFIKDEAVTSKGKKFTRYYLTRRGFDFIALSLTGEKADKYKLWYIEAFHKKAAVIKKHKLTKELNLGDDLWVTFRNEGKEYRNKMTQAINDHIVVYRNEVENKANDGRYYYHFSTLVNKTLNIKTPKGVGTRDAVDKRTLVKLEMLEDKIADMIVANAKADIYYKDSFRLIKKEVSKMLI